MDLHAVVVAFLAFITINTKMMMPFGYVGAVQDERKCQYLRPSRMLKIRCFEMNLREVPQYLKSSVEILDLAYNRIKKLKSNSFERYTSIKILVLYENKIQSVEPGTFAPLTSLEEIDLSNNALVSIPLDIFQLPSLRNLYVDGNELFNLERDLQALQTPIEAPLEYLNIADCGLEYLPDFGVLPKLSHINASLNPLTDLTVDSLANMCNLKSIDLQKTEISNCARQQVSRYLRYIGASLKFVPISVEDLDDNKCPDPYNQTVNSTTFHSCKAEAELVKALNWRWWAIAVAVALAVLVIAWWCCCRNAKKKKKTKKAKSKTKANALPTKQQPLVSPTLALKSHNDRTTLQDCDCA
ncbi:leucine-rich repeat and immunoglobulin-like domain-containing nogo receptor-interacting protein 2 [Zeugodacus cucurbitae]|uniref:leucine-rich repeat and immunoglobulin-like domain-containing nogo receptor-interacting protein 2 n=1 Tax=Zeugodacus cucurbitae TaxID=28588 RepID=UPI0023D951D8|nr:leucine-rich repeat and immunoglobulin-like domain-containing nogo receptor-interacting protein 2 [Zeugodacus cucurbitae]XP_011177860.2 leucine-rich repeat and immunoglobulin-like domain-containing nogo receptor-interacting protein 2 [Zeugodacus cucurbitae]XP_028894294.2 leucine-rich repeat and immunoglobulin-like domain-containing nogo receptor-interacting protein 2 [Zeugodacus cucurbitae]XP_054089294.1 leucine-rich repeat and immunoglobulin-like domain-containing nogo receptor-interacting p